jgi:hypothetical protein
MTDLSLTAQHRSLRIPGSAIMLLVAWASITVVLGVPAMKGGVFDAMSADDAMRLVQVRDLLAGQNWFDLTQHRLDPPGIPMHWSRVVDAPLAALIMLLRTFVGPDNAEAIALVVWPSLLLLAALALMVSIAGRGSNPAKAEVTQLAAIVTASSCVPVLIHFRAGGIDHHNLQIVLLLAFVVCLADLKRNAISAVLAGCFATLSLAIGLEMLPAIACASAVILVWLIWDGAVLSFSAGVYGAALTACSLLLSLFMVPSGDLTAPVCDAFGGPIILLAAGGGISLMAVAAVSRFYGTLPARLIASLASAALLLGLFAKTFPACIAAPYATVDPLVREVWLDRVSETMSMGTMAQNEPRNLLAVYGFSSLTIILALVAAVRDSHERFRWTVAIAVLAALLGVSVWEVRGAASANIVAAPFFILSAGTLRRTGTSRWMLLRTALLISPATLGGAGLAIWPALDWAANSQAQSMHATEGEACQKISGLMALSALPTGRVMALIYPGPAILAASNHAVFAAPYHRNNDGNLAMIHLMLASPDDARQLLAERKVDYVVTCLGSSELADFVELAPGGLAALLARDDVPEFLEQVDLGTSSVFRAWHVKGAALSPSR